MNRANSDDFRCEYFSFVKRIFERRLFLVSIAAAPFHGLVGVTIGQLRTQFAEAYEMAKELSQPAAMVTATTAQAKLAGLWIERSEQTRKQPDEMSDAEIAAILRTNSN